MTIAVSPAEIAGGALAILIGMVAISFLAEKLRSAPKPPDNLTGKSTIPVRYVDVGGMKLRYVKAGSGRTLVASSESISPSLLKEMDEVGNRRGHDRAFISLLRNAASWETATESYRNIKAPVSSVWGERDWSTPAERERDHSLIPGAETTTLENSGHFLPLDRPRELQDLLVRFAGVLWHTRRDQPTLRTFPQAVFTKGSVLDDRQEQMYTHIICRTH